MMKLLRKLKSDTTGASAAEYALIIAVMGAIIVIALNYLGNGIKTSFNSSATRLINGS